MHSYGAWQCLPDRRPSHSFKAGAKHVGFSPTRQALLALVTGGGGTQYVHGRSRMGIDSRVPIMPGRGTVKIRPQKACDCSN